MRKHNMFHVSARAYRAHQSIIVTLSSQTGMIAGIGIILACLVSSVEPLNLSSQELVCDNVYCGEFKPLRFKLKSQNALEKQCLQAQKKQNQLNTKLKKKKHQLGTA